MLQTEGVACAKAQRQKKESTLGNLGWGREGVLEGRGQTSQRVGKWYLKEDRLSATSHLDLWAFVV